MKFMRIAVALAFALAFGNAYAFHDGGVAYCDGCHTMHNSSGNTAVAKKGASTKFQGQAYLLQGSDDSSTCLNCHASAAAPTPTSYHIMTFPAPAAGAAPLNYTPAGDFAWLSISAAAGTKASYGAPITDKGERHGHNVVAADYSLSADTTLLTAPGGTYPAANLSCVSCHDPHSRARIVDAAGTIAYNQLTLKTLPIAASGSYGAAPTATEAVGVYRLLGGINYLADSTGFKFTNANPPVAVAPSGYNTVETAKDTRVAYGAGMSEWCANCHTAIHADSLDTSTSLIHPAGSDAKISMGTTVYGVATSQAGIYNNYKASGDLTNTQATSYTSLVPYEEGTTTLATLTTLAAGAKTGPTTGTENVACVTCHRAHASGFLSMTRWNNSGEFLTLGGVWPGTDAPAGEAQGGQYSRGQTQAQVTAAYYGRPATAFATYQRSLCNKCHGKD